MLRRSAEGRQHDTLRQSAEGRQHDTLRQSAEGRQHHKNVNLKVYDILGRTVTTLVNEEKEAGRYTVNFDASALSSGVYLYEIVVNDYRAVKKLITIK